MPDPKVLLSLVIPTYNEASNLATIVRLLSDVLNGIVGGNYELIVVDDDSPDRTWELAQALTSDNPHLRVMRRHDGRGLARAVVQGWLAANGEILGVIDGDMQHPPELLPKLLAAIEQGSDLAVASRYLEGGGVSTLRLTRRMISRGAQVLGLILLPTVLCRVSDPLSGYFLVRRDVIAGRDLDPIGYKILIEVLARGNVSKIAEVGYVFQERHRGGSKLTWRQYLEYVRHLWRLRRHCG